MQSWPELILALVLIFVFVAFLSLLPTSRYGAKVKSNRTQILVLGDIGRSPRMQNHAISILQLGIPVDLIGYVESDLHPRLAGQKNLTIHPIAKTPSVLNSGGKAGFFVTGPLKVIWQIWSLWTILGRGTPPAKWLLVQNPPSIPALLLASLLCPLRRTRLAIDWHNFGYTILALKLGPSHPLVTISRLYEQFFSRFADVNFAVSEAMCNELHTNFSLKRQAPVRRLYDKPAEDFKPITDDRQRGLALTKLIEQLDVPEQVWNGLTGKDGKTRVVVSSTSWTPDEDFGMLLDALIGYSQAPTDAQRPRLLVVITGKGPQKNDYLRKISELERDGKLELVTIRTAWLTTEDYAALLASADLGVCLHQSSSGVDLPMKVVDMFGAGLPVTGFAEYRSWPELVKEGINGRGFRDSAGLRVILESLLIGNLGELKKLRTNVTLDGGKRWQAEWEKVAGKTLGFVK